MGRMELREWVGADDHGWYRQVETWGNESIHLTEESSQFVPRPWEFTVNETCGVGLAKRGAYRRSSRGAEQIVDANVGFLRYADDEVGVAHFTGEPREVTYISVDPALMNGLLDAPIVGAAFTVTPQIELDHHRLLLARRRGADDLTMQLLSLDILARAYEQHRAGVRSYSRRTTASARRQLVSDACETLHTSHQAISLIDLAESVGCSPFHLSRVFREITGMTIPRYRRQLRVHGAVELLADGATDLAAVAAAVGFADHSHMTRSIVAQFGTTPSRLRHVLRAARATNGGPDRRDARLLAQPAGR